MISKIFQCFCFRLSKYIYNKMLQQLSSLSCLENRDSQSGNLFLLLINTLLAKYCALSNSDIYPPDRALNIRDGDNFDFIVIGAGTAGSVVGTRLVETRKWRVLVVEAGDYPSTTAEIPSMFFGSLLTDQIWNYHTKPSKHACLSYQNGVCRYPRGKLLGGCSSVNAMLYVRGPRNDYDSWVRKGNEGWSYADVMKSYKIFERLIARNIHNDGIYGKVGLLPLTNYKVKEKIRDSLLESAEELGYNILEKEGQPGFFESLQTIENGTRSNTAKIFLGSVRNSENLTLILNAYAEKVIIDEVQKAATGVKIRLAGKSLNLYANKEVILSAGALNSPQLLMLSGIGPRDHLNEVGLEMIQDLKVGDNLQDHMLFWMFSKVSDDAFEYTSILDDTYEYLINRTGRLANVGISNIHGFLNTKNNSEDADIQFLFIALPKGDNLSLDTFTNAISMNSDISKKLKMYNKDHNILVTAITLLQPKSRGKVYLRSKKPSDYPVVETGYLTDANGEDLETFLSAIRLAEAQLKTRAFQKLNAEILDIDIPNCRNLDFDTDEYWKCAVRNIGTTEYHPTSTCKMGTNNDDSAVVDPRLRVYGVKKLRVIDASVMPNIVRGNPSAPCIMIGQKGAEMIKEDYANEL